MRRVLRSLGSGVRIPCRPPIFLLRNTSPWKPELPLRLSCGSEPHRLPSKPPPYPIPWTLRHLLDRYPFFPLFFPLFRCISAFFSYPFNDGFRGKGNRYAAGEESFAPSGRPRMPRLPSHAEKSLGLLFFRNTPRCDVFGHQRLPIFINGEE